MKAVTHAWWLLASVATLAAAEPKAQPINLPAVMRLAGANNLDIQIAEQRFVEAQAVHQQAWQQFFPYLAPGLSFRRHEGDIQIVDGPIVETNKQSFAAGATVMAQLEIGDAIYQSLVTRRLAAAAQFAAEAQRQDSVYAAVVAFFELVRARAARGVAAESVRIATSYAGELGRAVEAGIAFRGDAFRAEAQAERNRLLARQTEEQQRLAAARLARALRLSALIELVPEGGDPAPVRLRPLPATADALVAEALQQRPELRQSEAQLAAARQARAGAVYGPLFPSLRADYAQGTLAGGTYEQGMGALGQTREYGVGLSWRIGPGGLFDSGRAQAAGARLRQGELELDRWRDEIALQVVEAHARAASLADQMENARKALAAAGQTLKLARERQHFGVGEVLENIQAEQELTRARFDYLTLITEHNRAQFALERAVGRAAGGAK